MDQRGPDEFGDFQTPQALASEVCRVIAQRGARPAVVVEPTCGLGNFVLAVLDRFPSARCIAAEINPTHVVKLQGRLASRKDGARCLVNCQSFFDVDWHATFRGLPEPFLVLGNPPWVTNAQLGTLGSTNLPPKSNFQNHAGLDALTGKSNFDISEWMLIRLSEAMVGRRAWLAMLCKTAVARKVLAYAWKKGMTLDWAEMRTINANAYFGAAVDACLFVCSISPEGRNAECSVYPDLGASQPSGLFGWRDAQFVANVSAYDRWKHLAGDGPYKWRSGVKHDCSKVMELRKEATGFRNGLGELVELEEDFVYPMLKSSEVANGHIDDPVRWMLVPQRAVGQDTLVVRRRAPKTWAYLERHGDALDRRASSIYRNRPRFSVFGVGEYTFSPWKVAISGFYKRLKFNVIRSAYGKPIVFDDTIYFVGCQTEVEARFVASLLNHEIANEFFSAFIFWDAKRPITVDLLSRLNLRSLAHELGIEDQWPADVDSLFASTSSSNQPPTDVTMDGKPRRRDDGR